MHDKDFSGTIDMDECMEILFRRFGKEQLEAKVAEFMQNDEDGDNDITFTEFLHMDMRSDKEGSPKHPGLLVSQGVVKTTREENGRLLQAVQDQQNKAQRARERNGLV